MAKVVKKSEKLVIKTFHKCWKIFKVAVKSMETRNFKDKVLIRKMSITKFSQVESGYSTPLNHWINYNLINNTLKKKFYVKHWISWKVGDQDRQKSN